MRKKARAQKSGGATELTEAQRATLENASGWLSEMSDFWLSRNSEANVRSVMKQVAKLASGAGVKHTIRDDYFCEGRPIDMTTDFMALKQEANEFLRPEDDPGHGSLRRIRRSRTSAFNFTGGK